MESPIVFLKQETYFHYNGVEYKRVDTENNLFWYQSTPESWVELKPDSEPFDKLERKYQSYAGV
jgi:hypothetical protein